MAEHVSSTRGIPVSIKDKIGLPFSLTFLDAEDVLAAVGFPYCTCILTTRGRKPSILFALTQMLSMCLSHRSNVTQRYFAEVVVSGRV